MKMNSILKYFKKRYDFYKSAVILLMGIIVAVKLLALLSTSSSNTDVGTKPGGKKDTVYVQLLNGPTNSAAAVNNTVDTTSVDVARAQETANHRNNSIHLSSQRLTAQGEALTAEKKQEAMPSEKETTFPFWFLAICSCLIIGIIMYTIFMNLPSINIKLNKDKDPELLTNAFRENAIEIQFLGNPRKIKRFSNKARFQYYYLQSKHAFGNGKNQEKQSQKVASYIIALLQIEYKPIAREELESFLNDPTLVSYFINLNRESIQIGKKLHP